MEPMDRLLEIMAHLRDPEGGCPWDLEQSFETIAPYTIEEAYEVDDAIRRRNWTDLRDELGDLLLQVVFHAQMAREQDLFDFREVVEGLADKLVRRHPHVFAEATATEAQAVIDAWDQHKERERAARAAREGRPPSAMDNVPAALPALLRATKLLRRAARAGIDQDPTEAFARTLTEHLGPPDSLDSETAGDWLFAMARVVAAAGHDPETAARSAAARFESRTRTRESASRPPSV